MGNCLIKRTVQTARFALIFIQFARFSRSPNQLIESLRIGCEHIQKFSRLFGITQQAITPLFRLMMFPFVFTGRVCHGIQLRLQRIGFNAPHHFADKLHLTAASLMLFVRNGSVELKSLAKLVIRKFNLCELSIRQSGKRLTDRLQGQHFTFFCTLRRRFNEVFVDQFVILNGAFVSHVRQV